MLRAYERGEYRAGDPELPVGAVLEVGTVPNPEAGRSGDLLTFTRTITDWIMQHNHAPRITVVGHDTIEFWAPLRIVSLPPTLPTATPVPYVPAQRETDLVAV